MGEYDSRLEGALRATGVGVWSIDLVNDGRLWAQGCAEILGLAGDADIDLAGVLDWVHPDDREQISKAVERAIAHGECFEADCRLVGLDDSEHWLRVKGCIHCTEPGRPDRIDGVLQDISERKRAEQDNARLERRLRQAQKMEALGTLAGGIAHDFNNVLAAIGGNAALALADLPPESPAGTSIHEIRRSAARAADLVRQILAFSRQEETQRKPMALQTAVAEVTRLLRASLPASIEIRSSSIASLPNILADATQIHQVVMNLAVNAAQAIGERAGVIEFRLDALTLPTNQALDIEELPAGRYVRLRVIDSGSGMDQETLNRIYDPFFTTKPVGQGTGLGLSVVHGIVQSYGGTISIDSTPGQGSTFCLLFPAVRGVNTAVSFATTPVPRGRGQHILYVDDEDALVFLAQRALQRLGYQVTGSTDPCAALNMFRAHPTQFDCVVTDLSMPGMSGQDLARELLKIRSDLPIVLTSGHLHPEDIQTARRIGIRDVMRKPDTIEELSRVLDDILRERSTSRSLSE